MIKPVIQNQIIDWSLHVKYLGVTLNYNLIFNEHVESVIQKARGAHAVLYPVINHNNNITLANGLAI